MKKAAFYKNLEDHLYQNFSVETAKSYLLRIKSFLKEYPNAAYLSIAHIEKHFAKLKQIGHKVTYRRMILAAIKVYYDFLCYHELIAYHPCKNFLISEKKPSGLNFTSLLSMEEMELLFTLKQNRYKNLINRDKVIIGLLIYQGITRSELANIRVQDIQDGAVFIRGNKNRLSRTLEFKANQMEPLIKYLETDRPKLLKAKTDHLILTLRGVPITTDAIHAFINRFADAFEHEMSPANIRKSVISYWINERGFKLEDVQIMAGHKYPSSTQMYVRVDVEKQREVLTRLHEGIFG